MNIYIYQNNRLLIGVIAPSLEEFNSNPSKFYPHIPEGQFVTSEYKYDYPIIENGTVRNKTRDERILLDNETQLLIQGEYVEGNLIKYKEYPTNLYKPKWVTPNWIEGATLEEVQEFKRVELKNARDTEILSHYLYTNNHIYDADLDSRNRLFQAQQLGVSIESNINWITADNQISNVSNADLVNIVNGIAYREQLAFNKFASKYTEVLNCTNIDDVKSIKY